MTKASLIIGASVRLGYGYILLIITAETHFATGFSPAGDIIGYFVPPGELALAALLC